MQSTTPTTPSRGKAVIRRGIVFYEGDTAAQRGRRFLERAIKRIEPTGIGSPEKINEYIARYKPLVVYDSRIYCFEVEGKVESGKTILTGLVGLTEYRDGLFSVISALQFQNIQNTIEVVPTKRIGSRSFALVKTKAAPFYSRTTGLKEQVTESVLGDSIFLLDEDSTGKYYYAQASNGYLGWVEKRRVVRMTKSAFVKWQNRPQVLFVKEYKKATVTIPIGASLPLTDSGQIQLPDGRKILVPLDYYRVPQERTKFIQQLLETAKQYLGTKYVWGGVTKAGIDCSGFVQMVYRANGINLPRDADQQSAVGLLVGFRGYTENLQPGDTLYFANRSGRITHTGIYLGNNEFIHATEPVVTVGSLDPKSKNYAEKHAAGFVLARRIIR
ncbi:MAG: C40 family peptidase [bacterium]|nr:C40 family peptidase [bacterium]